MSKIYFIAILVIVIAFLGSLAAIWNSPWLIWSALPDDKGNKVVIDTSLITGGPNQWINSVSQNVGINPLLTYATDSSQLGFIQSDTLVYAVIRPKIGQSSYLINKMESDGWSVNEQKKLLIAQKGNKDAFLTEEYGLSSIIKLIWNTFYISIIKSKGLYPLAIGNLQKINQETLANPVSFIVSKDKNYIQINGSRQSDVLGIDQGQNATPAPKSSQNNLLIAMPSSFISYIPSDLVKKMNEIINTGLDIKHTNPNILSIIQSSSNVQLQTTPGGIKLSINNPQKNVLEKLKQVIQDDNQYNYPEKHTFYLPDKTLAYEYVPGQTPVDWEIYNGNCQLYKGKDRDVYICENENNLFITLNKENTAQENNQIIGSKWLIIDKSSNININGNGQEGKFEINIEN